MTAQSLITNDPSANNAHVQLLFSEPECCGMRIKDLSIFAKKKTILTVDEIRFPKTGVVAIMGPSGSGKSTFLKVLSELMDENLSHKGKIDITCFDATNQKESICSHFAMVWQKPTVFPCSIWDNLKVPLRKGELDEQWEKQTAQRLSGGQQQRLSIAMGLLKDSNIFLFDEPTSALDPISTDKIEQIIENLGKTKLVLLVTHSLGQAKRVSDYSAMFHNHEDQGALCEFSSSQAFFKSPASPKSREFIMMETGI